MLTLSFNKQSLAVYSVCQTQTGAGAQKYFQRQHGPDP